MNGPRSVELRYGVEHTDRLLQQAAQAYDRYDILSARVEGTEHKVSSVVGDLLQQRKGPRVIALDLRSYTISI